VLLYAQEWTSLDPQQVAAAADNALAGTPPPAQRLVAAAAAAAAVVSGPSPTTSGGIGSVCGHPTSRHHSWAGDHMVSSCSSPSSSNGVCRGAPGSPPQGAAAARPGARAAGPPPVVPGSPSAPGGYQARAGKGKRPALSLTLSAPDVRQYNGGPASLCTPTSRQWESGARRATASPAALPRRRAGLGASRATPAPGPVLPPWLLAAAPVPRPGSPGSRQPALLPAKRPRRSLAGAAAASVGAAPALLPQQVWPALHGHQQQPQQQQQPVMVVCPSCLPSAAMATGAMMYHPAFPGPPTLPQLQQAAPHLMMAPGPGVPPCSGGLQDQQQQQQAMGMTAPIMSSAMEQQWGAGGTHLLSFPPQPPPLLQQGTQQAWQGGASGPPEGMPPWEGWPEAHPGAAGGPGHSQALSGQQVLQQLPLTGAALPAVAGWPWLPGQLAPPAAMDACRNVSSHGALPVEQQAGSGNGAWGSNCCVPGVSTAGSTLLPDLQDQAQPQLQQQQGMACQSPMALGAAIMDGVLAVRGGAGGAGASISSPQLLHPLAGAPQGLGSSAAGPVQPQQPPQRPAQQGPPASMVSEEELDQDLALLWHLLATDQDP
jgi:hypothetical protein